MAATVPVDIDRDAMKGQLERRSNITATLKTRARHQREFKQYQNSLWTFPSGDVQFAPKWTRHQEDYINPHLLKHERPIIAPRYGPDAACRKVTARDAKCRCSYCLTLAQDQESQKRESEKGLKKVVEQGRRRVRNTNNKAPWADWDMNGFDCPYSYDGDSDWLRDYEEDKQARAVQIDLLAMARPAKGKKRLARQGAIQSLPRPSLKPSTLSNIDEISILDFEETWEHLDLDNLDISAFALNTEHRPREPDEGSEWDWDRCSQF